MILNKIDNLKQNEERNLVTTDDLSCRALFTSLARANLLIISESMFLAMSLTMDDQIIHYSLLSAVDMIHGITQKKRSLAD